MSSTCPKFSARTARRRPGVDQGKFDFLVLGQPGLELFPLQPLELHFAARIAVV
jgi:hypothetical protein